MSIGALTPKAMQASADPQAKALQKAAQGFEAIFIRQMLSAARQAGTGDVMFGSEAQSTFRQMLDNQLAEQAAQQGVFGIGKLVQAHLSEQAL